MMIRNAANAIYVGLYGVQLRESKYETVYNSPYFT